jgi:hypothetical protein
MTPVPGGKTFEIHQPESRYLVLSFGTNCIFLLGWNPDNKEFPFRGVAVSLDDKKVRYHVKVNNTDFPLTSVPISEFLTVSDSVMSLLSFQKGFVCPTETVAFHLKR